MDVEVEGQEDPTPFLVYSGKTTPNFNGGLTTQLRYKRFSLGASFTFQFGNHTRLTSPFKDSYRLPIPETNASRDLLRRWQKSGDETTTDIPAFLNNNILSNDENQRLPGTWGNYTKHSMWDYSNIRVANASFFRCNNLQLTWNAEQELLTKLHIKNLSLSLSASNIFVIASDKFQGFDPELGDSVNPQTYTIGINIGF